MKRFIFVSALAMAAAGVTAANAGDLASELAFYPVDINVQALSDAEAGAVRGILHSGDGQSEIVGKLQSFAR